LFYIPYLGYSAIVEVFRLISTDEELWYNRKPCGRGINWCSLTTKGARSVVNYLLVDGAADEQKQPSNDKLITTSKSHKLASQRSYIYIFSQTFFFPVWLRSNERSLNLKMFCYLPYILKYGTKFQLN
jgi:hypothetical protein